MGSEKGRPYITLDDLKKYSLWKFSDMDNLDYPVTCFEDLPDDIRDLRIRARFVTRSGLELIGYLVSIRDVFSISICVGNQRFGFNRNLVKESLENLDKLGALLGKKLTLKDFSPLKFKTDIDVEGFKNIEGEFDLSKPVTDEERLRSVNEQYENNK